MQFEDIPHYHVDNSNSHLEHGVSVIIHVLRAIYHAIPKEIITMAELDPMYQALSDTVATTKGEVNSAIALLDGLHAKLDAALASAPGDPTAALAAVKAAVDALGVSNHALANTIVADALPADPAPAPAPVPDVPPAPPVDQTPPPADTPPVTDPTA